MSYIGNRSRIFLTDSYTKNQSDAKILELHGYTIIGNYESNIVITRYDEVLKDSSGEFWRVSSSTSLPYTTAGTGLPEGSSFVTVGDAALRQQLAAGVATGQGGLLVDGTSLYAVSLAGLKSVPTSELVRGQSVVLGATGRAGIFLWETSNSSADVTADPSEIAVVAPSSDLTGASGAWYRADTSNVTPEMAGAMGDGIANDTAACQAWINWLIANDINSVTVSGKYLVGMVVIDGADNLVINGGHWKMKYDLLGSFQYIFRVRNSNGVFTTNGIYEGTSASNTSFDANNLFGGLLVQESSFCGAFYCEYRNFTSQGIKANQLNGGTFTEGLLVFGCRFLDFPLDATTVEQCGIMLGVDAEYSRVANNWFFRIPSAARFVDSANSAFKDNIVMNLNGEPNNPNAAAFYALATTGGNGNKIQVSGNKFNHIETGQYIITVDGDPAKPQNENIISENEVLVSGNVNYSVRGTTVVNCPGTKIINNTFRIISRATGTIGVIRAKDSDGVVIEGNSFRGSDVGIELDSTLNADIGPNNQFHSTPSGKLVLKNGSTVLIKEQRSKVFRINSAGSFGFGDTTGLSVSRTGAGAYTVTHNFGDSDYGVFLTIDNKAEAPGRFFSVVRSVNSFDISVRDPGGVSVDEDLLVHLVIDQQNPNLL